VGCAREDLAELVLGGPRGDVALGDGGAAGKPAVASRNRDLRGARRERRERRAPGNVEPQLDVRRRHSPRTPIIHWIVSEKSRSDTEVTEHTEIESPGIHDHGEAITTWRSTQLRAGGYPRTKAGPSSADRSLRTAANVRVQYRPLGSSPRRAEVTRRPPSTRRSSPRESTTTERPSPHGGRPNSGLGATRGPSRPVERGQIAANGCERACPVPPLSSTALSVPPFSIRGSRVVGRECAWRGAVPATASAASGDAPSRIARDETDQSVPNGLRLPSALNRFPSIVGTTIDSSIRRATKIVPGSPISDW